MKLNVNYSVSPSEVLSYIAWYDEPRKNARIFNHYGCGGRTTAFWKVPLDGLPKHYSKEETIECVRCHAVLPLVRDVFAEAFLSALSENGMPTFTIKAKDALAIPVLRAYKRECEEHGLEAQARYVQLAIDEIKLWQKNHIEQTKLPDHVHRPVTETEEQTTKDFWKNHPDPTGYNSRYDPLG